MSAAGGGTATHDGDRVVSGASGGGAPARARAGGRRTGMVGVLLRIELLKAVKRRAFWVTWGAFAAFNIVSTVESVRSAHRYDWASYALPEIWSDIVLPLTGPGTLFIAVLMILLFAPEFSWRTGRQNVIDGLSKERLYAGKVMVLAGLVLLFVVTAVSVGVGGTLFSPDESGPEIIRSTDLSYLAGAVLNLLILGSAGLMLSALIRSAGPGLGVLFLYIIVEEGIIGLMQRGGEALKRLTEFLPFNLVRDLGDDLAHYPEVLARVNADRAERGVAPLEYLDVDVMAIAVLTYSAIFLLIAFLSMRKRDL